MLIEGTPNELMKFVNRVADNRLVGEKVTEMMIAHEDEISRLSKKNTEDCAKAYKLGAQTEREDNGS